MKKILVTGGAGFIGYNIASLMARPKQNHVYIIDDLSKEGMDEHFERLIQKENVTFYDMDMSDAGTYDRIAPEFDQVYHLAAVVGVGKVTDRPDLTLKVNSLSTIYLLEHMKKMKNRPRIVFASSCENYAGSIACGVAPVPTPEDIPLCIEDVHNPRWTYAATKILGEIACLQYAKKYGFESVVVRYHNVYGPRMGTQHVIPAFIQRLKKDPAKLEMFGGYQYRTFCYVTDAAKMTVSLMNNDKALNRVVNVGNDNDYLKISDVAKGLSRIMGISPEYVESGAPDGSTDRRMPDLGLIRALGSYVYEVPFEKGLTNTVRWYCGNAAVPRIKGEATCAY